MLFLFLISVGLIDLGVSNIFEKLYCIVSSLIKTLLSQCSFFKYFPCDCLASAMGAQRLRAAVLGGESTKAAVSPKCNS